MTLVCVLATLILMLNVATEARGEDASAGQGTTPTSAARSGDVPPPPKGLLPKAFRAYVGFAGIVNGSLISEPKNKTVELNGAQYIAPYPGFGGVGGGGGLALGLGWKAINLEVGVEWTSDQGEGRIDGFTYTLSQTTRHIPITLRFEVPDLKVRPSIFGGLDWVSPSDAQLKQPPGYTLVPPLTGAASEDYTAWRFGFGFDIMLNKQMRIPIRIAASYTPLDRETIDDLVVKEMSNGVVSGIQYRSTWQWQPQISLGFSYDFAHF